MSKLHFRPLGSNCAELGVGEWLVLISYETPVAVSNTRNHHVFVTSSKFSNTTTKHINKWVDGRVVACVSQDRIESIANGSYGPSKDQLTSLAPHSIISCNLLTREL